MSITVDSLVIDPPAFDDTNHLFMTGRASFSDGSTLVHELLFGPELVLTLNDEQIQAMGVVGFKEVVARHISDSGEG